MHVIVVKNCAFDPPRASLLPLPPNLFAQTNFKSNNRSSNLINKHNTSSLGLQFWLRQREIGLVAVQDNLP